MELKKRPKKFGLVDFEYVMKWKKSLHIIHKAWIAYPSPHSTSLEIHEDQPYNRNVSIFRTLPVDQELPPLQEWYYNHPNTCQTSCSYEKSYLSTLLPLHSNDLKVVP